MLIAPSKYRCPASPLSMAARIASATSAHIDEGEPAAGTAGIFALEKKANVFGRRAARVTGAEENRGIHGDDGKRIGVALECRLLREQLGAVIRPSRNDAERRFVLFASNVARGPR